MSLKLARITRDFWLKENLVKLHIMKNVQDLNNRKVPIVRIDPSLEKYRVNTPFPNKLEKVNQIFKTAKLPKKKPGN